MTKPTPPGNIVLIGFMGSGKSSVGRLVARRRRMRLVDTDRLVVEAAGGKQISDIFRDEGEEHFRELESQALASLVGKEGFVLATGGGIVTRPENMDLFHKIGFTVWLTADEDTILERVSRNNKRPLLQTENPRKTIADLFAKRRPLYEQAADCIIDSTGLPLSVAVRQVIERADQFYPPENHPSDIATPPSQPAQQ